MKALEKAKNFVSGWLRDETGQVATEYMLAIAVLVIAVVGATLVLSPELRRGITNWGTGFEVVYAGNGETGLPKP